MTRNILLVDDDELILIALEELFRRAGYGVRCAASGKEALALAAREGFAAVVLDIVMPGMSGLEVCRELRATSGHRKTPIILLTAKSAPEEKEKGLQAGADLFLAKPFDPAALLEVVAQVCDSGPPAKAP